MRTNDLWLHYNADREDQILAAAEAILRKRLDRQGKIGEPNEATAYLRAHCAHLEHEIFGVIFLDTRHHIIAIEDMFRGGVDGAALKHNASSTILFHNHPSANPEPSAADRGVTQNLKQALALVNCRVLDHIIVTADTCTSMASRGWV